MPYDTDDQRPVRLADLYRGRRDVLWAGGYKTQEANYGRYRGHLQGHLDLGIYPLADEGTCTWAVVQVEVDDPDRLLQLHKLLVGFGLVPVVIRVHGSVYHVVVFVVGRVRAAAIRLVLGTVAREAGFTKPVVVPRVDQPGDDPTSGGYVALPYVGACPVTAANGRRPKHIPARGHRTAVDLEQQRDLTLEEFLDHAEASRVAPETIYGVAERLRTDTAPAEAAPTNGKRSGASAATVGSTGQATTKARKLPRTKGAASNDPHVEAIHSVVIAYGLPPLAVQVALELRRTAKPETGISWQRRETVAKTLRKSRATIFRALEALRRVGLVVPVEDLRPGGRWPRVGYRFVLGGVQGSAAAAPGPEVPPEPRGSIETVGGPADGPRPEMWR